MFQTLFCFGLIISAVVMVSSKTTQSSFLDEHYQLSDQFIKRINEHRSTWEAGRNFAKNVTMKYIRSLMGVRLDTNKRRLPKIHYEIENIELPMNFDAREKWPNCPSIRQIKDQGNCGSCWAVSSTTVMTDRFCIHSNGTKNFTFSSENLLSCCKTCGNGCNGGYPEVAWDYWTNTGIVSGGDYGSKQGCQPYSIKPCYHDVERLDSTCEDVNSVTPACQHQCTNSNYDEPYKTDRHFGVNANYITRDVVAIQREIMKNGPVVAALMMYTDLLHYKSGVYQHVEGEFIGGHAGKVIGWGVERDTPYWLIANSWNTNWGEKGFFKILRGVDHCRIETRISAGIPKIT